jgi:cytochrome c peroxidase
VVTGLVAASIIFTIIFIGYRNGGEPAEGEFCASTTAELAVTARGLGVEDRPARLRLARGMLQSEKIQPFTAPIEPINNRGDAARVELGYQLFFDPVLSGNRNTSCASCHHPDSGMADGLPEAVGAGGRIWDTPWRHRQSYLRNTPSLFNVAFNTLQFWDGRAGSLEEQSLIPIFAADEMNQQSVTEMLRRLARDPSLP